MAVPYTFANATTSIPLSQLDSNFATAITIGNTAVYLGNTTTSFGNVTLTNATISSGNVTLTSATVPTVIGGTTASSTLTLQSTSGVGTSDAISFKVGNNGATTAMTVNTSGNVGIGTTSTSSALEVYRSSGENVLKITNAGTASSWLSMSPGSSGSAYIHNISATAPTVFTTNSTERMRIDSSGNVGIGTSSPSSYGLFVIDRGTSASSMAYFKNNATNGAWTSYDYNGTVYGYIGSGSNLVTGAATSDFVLRSTANMIFGVGTSEKMRIDSSGNLLVGRTNNPSGLSNSLYVTGAYSNTTPSGANVFVNTDGSFFRSTSSLKYKTDIKDYSRGLSDVAKLRPVFYKPKEGLHVNQQFAGFIAEEIQDAGLTEFVQYAEDGNPDALSYGNMVALCIKAIQELKAELDALKGTK